VPSNTKFSALQIPHINLQFCISCINLTLYVVKNINLKPIHNFCFSSGFGFRFLGLRCDSFPFLLSFNSLSILHTNYFVGLLTTSFSCQSRLYLSLCARVPKFLSSVPLLPVSSFVSSVFYFEFVYLLHLLFHPVAAVCRLVQKQERDNTKRRNNKQNNTKTHNTQNSKKIHKKHT